MTAHDPHPPTPTHVEADPSARTTIVVGVVGGALLLAIVVFTIVLFQNAQYLQEREKLWGTQPQELRELQFQQVAPISAYGVVDPQENLYSVPIERAMELAVERLRTPQPPSTMPAGADAAGRSEEKP